MRRPSVSKKENLFAASRFVLPEHRELYLRMKAEEARYVPPALDEEQRAELSLRVWQAFGERRPIHLVYYDGTAPQRIAGLPVHLDQAQRRVKLRTDEGTKWIRLADLLEVEPG